MTEAYHVNLDNLTIGDLETFERADELKATEMIELLDRALEDVDVRTLPLSQLTVIIKAISDAVGELGNPQVGGKN